MEFLRNPWAIPRKSYGTSYEIFIEFLRHPQEIAGKSLEILRKIEIPKTSFADS